MNSIENNSDVASFAIGIDLGTTHCSLAYRELKTDVSPPTILPITQVVSPGETKALPLLPSFLYIPVSSERGTAQFALPWDNEPQEIVGTYARERGAQAPMRLVASAKSWLSYGAVNRRDAILPWGSPDDVARISPLDACARYLTHIRQAWDDSHPDAPLAKQDIVITIPASFDAVARELTVEAAKLSGFPESIRLLEEPQAALYAWLAEHHADWRDRIQVGDTILVCDIGGGTTDFSLVQAQQEDGVLRLERIAVGEHILLGGDNMDLALAYAVRHDLETQGQTLDDWQMRALTYACRVAKEALLSNSDDKAHPVVIPGRTSRLIGGTIRAELSRQTLETVLVDGFFPEVASSTKPVAPRRVGLSTLGLPYASDAGVTRHLAAFLQGAEAHKKEGHSFVHPTVLLFNGGVTRSQIIRDRIMTTLSQWIASEGGEPLRLLDGTCPDLAVSRGAAYYAESRVSGGLRIRSTTAQTYYVGVERNELAVPGVPARVDALCIAPFGMEEGTEVELPEPLGLFVGEPVSFRFFTTTNRPDDRVGTIASPLALNELAPIETTLDGESGDVAHVKLRAQVTETGTLELSAVDMATQTRWKLSFDVRVQ